MRRKKFVRRLVSKWSSYIQNDLSTDIAISLLKRATRLVKKAAIAFRDPKFPTPQLLSIPELACLQKYDSTIVPLHDEDSISECTSRRVLKGATELSVAFGKFLRPGFTGHTDMKNESHQFQSRDAGYRLDPAREKEASNSTAVLRPLQTLVENMAAPTRVLERSGEGGQRRVYSDRKLKSNCTIANSMRSLSNAQNTYPVFDAVGKDAANTMPKTQQKGV